MKNNNNMTPSITDTWFSGGELVGLPGMPTTDRRVRSRASAEGWPSRKRVGRGGGREYPMSCLPAETRAALAASNLNHRLQTEAGHAGSLAARKVALMERVQAKARETRLEHDLARAQQLSERDAARMDTKLAVLAAFDEYRTSAGLPITRAAHLFAEHYSQGEIEIDAAVRAALPDVCPASLDRWRKQLGVHGVTRLAGRYGNRKGSGAIDTQPEIASFIVAMLVDHPHATEKHIEKGLRARFKHRDDLLMPKARSIGRWIKKWKHENAQAFEAVRNPDAWKSRYMTAMGSASESIVRLNQRWELDSTPGDVMLTDGRHMVLGAIDVYSRRAKLLVMKTSRAAGVATLMRHALLDWGVPEEIKTDRGSDYVSKHAKRVVEGLAIEQLLCPPFQPWHKPHIERFFRTFSHDLVELLAGFIGHSVTDRKAIEDRSAFSERLFKRDGVLEVKLSSVEFQRFCGEWCENVYARQAHDGLDGKSPFEMTVAWTGETRRIEDERALDVLLAEAPGDGLRTIQKKGIAFDGTYFIAPEFGPRIGEQARVKNDPIDLGRIYVFDLNGEPICIAEAPERTGVDRREVATKAKALQREHIADARRALKSTARKLKTADIVTEILAERAEAAGKLARLPGASTAYTSTGLEQAGRAARMNRAPESTVSAEELADARARLERAAARQSAAVTMLPKSPRVDYQAWKTLDAQVRLGRLLTEEERLFYEGFAQTAEFRALRRVEESFDQTVSANGGAT